MRYRIIMRTLHSDGQEVLSYGISCSGISVWDITTNERQLADLVARCNRLELNPCHLMDVVEDFVNAWGNPECMLAFG